MTKIELDIQPLLQNINKIITSGIEQLFYDIKISSLKKDLEDCRNQMHEYKRELEKYKKMREEPTENIILNIEEKSEDCESLDAVAVLDDDSLETESSDEEVMELTEVVEAVAILEADETDKESLDEEEEAVEAVEAVASLEEDAEEEVEEEEVEEEEEEVEEEEEEVEEEEVEEEEVEAVASLEDEEEEVFEVEIDDVSYFTNNDENGVLYAVDENGDPGNKVGYLKDGEPFFY